ncbi:MAG TPA: YCF48-related protein [Mycobacteriales bacterium]|nr:YCF48-related protein [Mycobacteriales bacterium]
MRRRIIAAVSAALLLAAPGMGSAAAPAAVSVIQNCIGDVSSAASPGGRELVSIEFSDRATGWAAGGGQIVRTTDGGAHWKVVYRNAAADLLQIDAFNDRDAWAVGAGEILRTTDGGQSWHSLPARCPMVSAVDFFSPRAGVAVAGNTLLRTTDGGRAWAARPAPRNLQSVCFSDARHGWAGAHGQVYRTVDGGRTWRLAVAGPTWSRRERHDTDALVECAGPNAGWAELDVADAAMNQQPHVGYHLSAPRSRPIFSEGYFPYPGLPKRLPDSPGGYPDTFSAIDGQAAAFIDDCPACGADTAELAIATEGGSTLGATRRVRHINTATAAAFLSASSGWVVGATPAYGGKNQRWRIVHTADGGKTWTTQYQS